MDKSQDTQRRIHDSIIAEINDLEGIAMNNYEKHIQMRINNILDELTSIEGDMRCCGNCIQFINSCKIGNQDHYKESLPFRCCEYWDYDGLTADERMIWMRR